MSSRLSVRLLAAALVLVSARLTAHPAAVTLNLNDVDIGTFITTVSEVTGTNFVVDPRVKGKVTVISSTPMEPAAVYATFLSVLQVQGFVAIPSGPVTKIVPETNAREVASARLAEGVPRDAIVTEALALHYASATQLVPILRPLVPQWGQLAAYAPANVLIISDRAANVRRISQILRQIDAAGDQGVQVVALDNAGAEEVSKMVASLIAQDKAVDPSAHPVAAIADERTNSLVIAGTRADREHYAAVIKQLDAPDKNSGNTQVVYLHYADAEDLAPILQGYAQQAKQAETKAMTGTSGFGGSGLGGSGFGGSNSGFGGSGSSFGNNSNNQQQQQTTQSRESANASVNQQGNNPDLKVLADRDTNALVITAPPKIMQQVKKVIAQLDIRRAQVLVEGIVAEVSATKQSQLGLDFAIFNPSAVAGAGLFNQSTINTVQGLSGQSTSSTGLSGTTATTGLASSSLTGVSPLASVGLGLLSQGATIAGGMISNGGKSGTSFAFILQALASDSDTNILSAPSLVTLDNQEAKISVGQSVPVLTGQFANTGVSSASGVVNPFQTIQDQDVGLILGITPTINDGNTIRLKIDLENSSISSGTAGTASLVTNKRTVTDTVTVEDGQILVLGGLVDNQVNATRSGIPYLSDIPVLGALFGSRTYMRTKRNLMVFIHPVVLRQPGDANFYTRRKYEEERNAEVEAQHTAPQEGGDQPVIYRWDDYLRDHNRPGMSPAPASSSPGAAPLRSGATLPPSPPLPEAPPAPPVLEPRSALPADSSAVAPAAASSAAPSATR